MEARVGARIELVQPRRWVAPRDAGWLLALVAVSGLLHAWLVGTTFVTARDSLGFARLALNLGAPATGPAGLLDGDKPRTFIDVLKAAEHPPGYPVAVLAASRLVRAAYPAPLTEQMLLSCQVASTAAGVLLVLPMYLLGRSLYGRFAGFASAGLFQVLPVVARVTSDGLSESLYLLCAATALGFGVRGVRHRSTLNFLLCGMTTGLAYLVRPEGLIVSLTIGVVVGGLDLLRRWPRDVAAGRLLALGVGVGIAATPYMLLIGGVSNKASTNELWNRIKGNPRSNLGAWDSSHSQSAGSPVLFAAWYDPARDGGQSIWAAKAVATEVWKSSHFLPCVVPLIGLGVVGLGRLRRKVLGEPEHAVLPLLGLINLAVLFVLALKIGYVSERHTLLIVLVACMMTAAALEPIGRDLLPLRNGPAWLLAAVLATGLPAALRPLHENRIGHYHAGKFLAATAGPGDVVVDPFSWALFYSGRTLYHVTDDPPDAPVIYAVWENAKDNPHSRLPRRDDALNVARDGWSDVVFQWPPDGPPNQAKVTVYKLDRAAKDAVRAVAGGQATPFLVRPGPRPER
jgi:hypothetical protein